MPDSHALVFALGLLLSQAALEVVDTHVHIVSTANEIDYLWAKTPASLNRTCPCRPPCLCNWTLQTHGEYERLTAGAFGAGSISRAVFCEVDASPSQWLQEATWVQMGGGQKGGSTRVGAIVAQPPPGFGLKATSYYAANLDKLQKLPLVRGVRPPGWMGSISMPNATATAALVELGRRGLSADLNVAITTGPGLALQIVQSAPSTTFVIEHMGGANPAGSTAQHLADWTNAIQALAKQTNIGCLQVGGVVAGYKNASHLHADGMGEIQPFVRAAIQAMGFKRLCFEGNWFFDNFGPPFYSTYRDWAGMLMSILKAEGATADETAAVLRDNALRVYQMG